jgi:NitT/TauT family transport system substrate-binding protein
MASVITLTACSGSDTEPGSTNSNGPEKTTLKVGILPIPDSAPIQIAIDKGYFKEEGLSVQPSIEVGSAQALPKVVSGSLDVSLANYVSTFSLQQSGLGKFKIIADSFQAAPDTFVIMVAKDSKIRTPADLAGKKIAVNTLNNIGTLAVTQTLKVSGVQVNPSQFAPMPLPDMAAALKNGTVDAAWMSEPFISINQKQGAQKLVDSMAGPTADFPVAGWGVSEEFAAKNPKTVAAFQRAVGKAQQLASTDRKVVEAALPKYSKIDAATAAVITLGKYPTTLNEARLQRVADLMTELGYLKGHFDVKPLIASAPAG